MSTGCWAWSEMPSVAGDPMTAQDDSLSLLASAGPFSWRWLAAMRGNPLEAVTEIAREHGDVGSFRFGPERVFVVSSPGHIRQVLVQEPEVFRKGRRLLRALRPLLGQGLITSEGDLHARQRKMIAPHFHPRNVVGYVELIARLGEQASDEWKDGEQVELVQAMRRLTMDLVGEMLLSTPFEDDPRLVQAITDAFDWEMHALTHLVNLPLAVPTRRNLRMRAALAYLRTRFGAVIEERWREGGEGRDMLSMLLSLRDEDGKRLSPQQVFDETVTLSGAALESSTDALAWTHYLLARNPEVQQRLREEVDLACRDRRICADDLSRLPFASAVFKEALRLYPPAALIMRSATRSTSLGGHKVPKGSIIVLAPWVLHRRPDIYPEPERFDPDRFTPSEERKIPKGGYLPFGAGPRVCLGSHLALLEGQVLTATFAKRLEMTSDGQPPVRPVFRINVRAQDGVWVRVDRR